MRVSEDIIPGTTRQDVPLQPQDCDCWLLAAGCVTQRRRVMRVLMLAFGVLAAATLAAQTFRGTIFGTVMDPSAAVASGAKGAARHVARGIDRATRTIADGS